MSPSQRPDSLESVDYTGVLRRRWWVVVAGAVAGLIGALAYITIAPKSYSATATVNVAATGADQSNTNVSNSRTGGTVNLDTEAQIVTSGTVATIAAKMMHSSEPIYRLTKKVSVTVPPNSTVLTINCGASTATAAATCANDFAKAYLQNRSATAKNVLDAQAKDLQGKITDLNKSVARLNKSIGSLPKNSPTRATDKQDVNNDRLQLASLTHQLSVVTGQASNVNGGSVITPATPPGKPSSPKKSLVLPSGLVAGLLVGLIAAFVWDRRDRRLHSPQDVERLLDIPVMLSLPRNTFSRQVALASPRSRAGRAFTELAHTAAASLGEGSHVLLVAGSTPGPGVSVVAANLAAALGRTHSEAVLVCADLRDSVATELFGLVDSRGLAEVVAGRATVGEVARGPAREPGLWVIPPGADTSLAEYLQHDTAKALTSQLRRDARYVIIEAQTSDDGADTFAFAEFADAALLTVEMDNTDRHEAADCIKRLHLMRTPILGAVVLPPIKGRPGVRIPRPGQPRLTSEPVDGRNGAVAGRGYGGPSTLSGGTPAGTSDGPDRPARPRDGYVDPAERVHGR